MFRVIIAGSRDFEDYQLLKSKADKYLSNIKDDVTVVCGLARGADTLGEKYARERKYAVAYYPADWKNLGKAAGYVRNEQMAKNADALIAFWDGQSAGTAHMINLAAKYNLPTRIVRF